MLSNSAEYALRAAAFLATRQGRACRAQVISESARLPRGYSSKILQDLVRAGLAVSQRGPNGGFTLARAPNEISLLEVVNAVEPIRRIRVCPLGIPSHEKKLCRLHQTIDDAFSVIETSLASTTIAELLEPAQAGSRCQFPGPDGEPPRC